MRQASAELLSLALMDARNHTLHLFSQFEQAGAQHKSLPASFNNLSAGPSPLWLLGHIGWFQEWWIGRNMQRAMGTRCEPGHARLSSIEPHADRWWSPSQTGSISDVADVAHCRAYLLDTLESTLELLEKAGVHAGADSDDALYFYRLALFHEDMQCEVLTSLAQSLGVPLDKPLRDVFMPPPMALRDPLLIPGTAWQLGSRTGPGAGFAFDNEKPAHPADVPAFEIDAQPVTWAQYVEFVDDGGYDREELWHPGGWRWLQSFEDGEGGEGRRAPRHVDQIGVASGAVMQTRFGQRMRMQGNQPALHVSWWEADAWCRWAGRRLPFEVEWEIAASTAVRRGFRWGDVWEWTASTFRPYPGFSADPWADYSVPAFGARKVLRGASFATRARMKAPAFRRFELEGRDDLFCGFRSCSL
ncbi:MAG: ergothioneine biosynthesis protein EgtB [Comamonadaceae bacterium]|nr:MAG: ergothioneine biosynthesis protein EgtB [Comamonadaceae bacterium]